MYRPRRAWSSALFGAWLNLRGIPFNTDCRLLHAPQRFFLRRVVSLCPPWTEKPQHYLRGTEDTEAFILVAASDHVVFHPPESHLSLRLIHLRRYTCRGQETCRGLVVLGLGKNGRQRAKAQGLGVHGLGRARYQRPRIKDSERGYRWQTGLVFPSP